ncbi:MAG: hypothetical protein ACOC2Q_02625 [Spirochaetota bacterium]
MTATITPRITTNALRIVFGDESPYASGVATLATLTQRELAIRFRARAMELHPDRAGTIGESSEVLEHAFKRLHGAYRVLSRLLEDESLRNHVLDAARRQPGATAGGGLWTPGMRSSAREPAERRQAEPRRSDRKQADRPSDSSGVGRYFGGRIPTGELRFAQFLYYNRVIDWKTMIDAVTWQYRVRPKVGEIGRSYHFLDFDSVTRVLRSSPRGELFGDTAMKLGLLDRRQLSVVLGKQHQLNYPIGRYFLENDILSRPEIDHLLAQNRRHNMKARSTRR